MLKIDKNIPLPSSKPSMRHAELYETAGDLEIGDSFEYVFPRKEGSSQKTSQAITVCGSLLRTRFTDRRFSIRTVLGDTVRIWRIDLKPAVLSQKKSSTPKGETK